MSLAPLGRAAITGSAERNAPCVGVETKQREHETQTAGLSAHKYSVCLLVL